MKIIYATDVHLDFLSIEQREDWIKSLSKLDGEALYLTGDITIGPYVEETLVSFAKHLAPRQVFFVLGNHDFYGSSFEQITAVVKHITSQWPNLCWMTQGYQSIGDTAVIGHEGWYDGRAGHGTSSFIYHRMSDFQKAGIKDLFMTTFLGPTEIYATLRRLGDISAHIVAEQFHQVVSQGFKKIHVLTHVPPYEEVSWYQGAPRKPEFSPFYVNTAMGDVLMTLANDHPDIQITTLAGHSHSFRDVMISPNLRVRVGSAMYGDPEAIELTL